MQRIQVWVRFALAAFVFATPATAFAQLTKAGVVTAMLGTVTVSRASLSEPMPLKFKDDVFAQDRVVTGDDSAARILLGGRAVVTVRERSSLTITEVPKVSTIDVGEGRAAIAVAKERMKPGETVEIRTPNAVAGIRGTIVVVEVDRTTPAAQGPAAFTTRFTVITGEVLVRKLQGGQPFGFGVALGTNQQARFAGSAPVEVRSLPVPEARQLSNSFKIKKSDPPAAASALLVTQAQALASNVVTNENSNSKGDLTQSQDVNALRSTTLAPRIGRDDVQVTAIQQVNSSGATSNTDGSSSGLLSNSLLSNSLVGKRRGGR